MNKLVNAFKGKSRNAYYYAYDGFTSQPSKDIVYANTQTHTPRGPDTQTPDTHQNPIQGESLTVDPETTNNLIVITMRGGVFEIKIIK